jgi:transglutaminase-like putative cysteine protease
VSCEQTYSVTEPSYLAVQVAAATGPQITIDEQVSVTVNGTDLAARSTVATEHGGRIHLLDVPVGSLRVAYQATVDTPGPGGRTPDPGDEHERLIYLRPSRYCPSDGLAGWAGGELGSLRGRDLVEAVVSWVGGRTAYVLGSTGPVDDATDTLLRAEGVCRDFAHLCIAICRASDVPARFAAVYAPGLSPMDFHAVFEAHVDGGWEVFDATGLAPRQSLVRIATGRDAADTAFVSVYGGRVDLLTTQITAVVDGALPVDGGGPVVLP